MIEKKQISQCGRHLSDMVALICFSLCTICEHPVAVMKVAQKQSFVLNSAEFSE